MSQNKIPASELILNEDGSIYHLKIRPEHVADTIITVGDPERVAEVSKHFDYIDFQKSNREFVTHTGTLANKRISVISTGIGTDNIDIVLNEIDALVNIDFESREIKTKHTALNFIRIGTSGCLQEDIPLDSFLFTRFSIGLDNLFTFYETKQDRNTVNVQTDFQDFCLKRKIPGYATVWHACNQDLFEKLKSNADFDGITVTCPGFYGPQGRQLRIPSKLKPFLEQLSNFKSGETRITNFEMETSGIYGMAHLLGHKAISCNALLANRKSGTFSSQPKKTVGKLIEVVLERLIH